MGQLDFATAWATLLLCEQAGDKACQQCASCQLMAAGNHPDYFQLGVLEKAKQIKVDQVRELIQFSVQTPQCSDRQVVVIHPLEAMNVSGCNALLKTLEEPTGQVYFMLLASDLARIPATIVSRCQRIHFERNAQSMMLRWLEQEVGLANDPDLLLRLANGSPLNALALADSDTLHWRMTVLKQLAHWLATRRDLVALMDEWVQHDEGLLYRFVSSVMQDLWKLSLGVSAQHLTNRDCEDTLHQMLYHCRDMNLTEVVARLERLWQYLQSPQNFNHRLMWEEWLLSSLPSSTKRNTHVN